MENNRYRLIVLARWRDVAEVAMPASGPLYDLVYTPAVIRARVSHLDPEQQDQIEQITRIIRSGFDPGGALKPRPRIKRITLVGDHARPGWAEDTDAPVAAPYEFWIVVSDRLFTRKRLWEATKAQIRRELGEDCRVGLSFSSARAVRTGKAMEDSFIVDRLSAGITLYRAKYDEPPRRRRRDYRRQWSEALARYRQADAAFLKVRVAFDAAERAWFAARAQRDLMSEEEQQQLRDEIGLDRVYEDERRTGNAREETVGALLNTPAVDLATVIWKLEFILETHFDKDIEKLILADLRRLESGVTWAGRAA
jgi:hypothetical protein